MGFSKHPDARLDGWEGPAYPEPFIQELGDALRELDGLNGADLKAFGRLVPGYVEAQDNVVTGDGYRWFWMLEFNLRGSNGGQVRIAVPGMSTPPDQWDRSLAVYTKGGVSEKAYATIVVIMTGLVQTEIARARS